jgi:hypothetical protein
MQNHINDCLRTVVDMDRIGRISWMAIGKSGNRKEKVVYQRLFLLLLGYGG